MDKSVFFFPKFFEFPRYSQCFVSFAEWLLPILSFQTFCPVGTAVTFTAVIARNFSYIAGCGFSLPASCFLYGLSVKTDVTVIFFIISHILFSADLFCEFLCPQLFV